ncbi:hypothetical protein CDAR_555361 [Caerostris darwini]|uniref:Uncharacterized protein n=1 Tax=Caerostris darwini TaxID=1538125 RepID=A0AAV4RH94_9ARAC|nr:hypothetical protein CDAR_555361 [Caerostris darwini]
MPIPESDVKRRRSFAEEDKKRHLQQQKISNWTRDKNKKMQNSKTSRRCSLGNSKFAAVIAYIEPPVLDDITTRHHMVEHSHRRA